MDNRRTPRGIQRLNQWLLPIVFTALIAAMGFYAMREQTTSLGLATVAANQKIVMSNQDTMIEDIKLIKDRQHEVKEALDQQTNQLKIDRIRITTIHHQKGIQTCYGCHKMRRGD